MKNNLLNNKPKLSLSKAVKPTAVAPEPKQNKPTTVTKGSKGDTWDRFLEAADKRKNETKDIKENGKLVWIDNDLKNKIDLIRSCGAINCPTSYLINAALQIFIEDNSERIEQLVKQQIKL